MGLEENKRVAQAILVNDFLDGSDEGWNRWLSYFTDDFVHTYMGTSCESDTWVGRAAVRAALERFAGMFETWSPAIDEVIAEGNKVVVLYHTKAESVNAGFPYHMSYAATFDFDDEGLVTKFVEYGDTAMTDRLFEAEAAATA